MENIFGQIKIFDLPGTTMFDQPKRGVDFITPPTETDCERDMQLF